MTNTREPANRKLFSSLQEEIDYRREENYAKIQIIKQLTYMKVAPSNSNVTSGTCSCKIASTHSYRIDNIYKELSIDLETNTKSKKNLHKTKPNKTKISFKS